MAESRVSSGCLKLLQLTLSYKVAGLVMSSSLALDFLLSAHPVLTSDIALGRLIIKYGPYCPPLSLYASPLPCVFAALSRRWDLFPLTFKHGLAV